LNSWQSEARIFHLNESESMNLIASPSGPLQGQVALSGDKSISHRAALFSAFARGESRIENFLDAGVTRAMLEALTALGIPVQLDGTTLLIESEE
jgi:3-phosphoshikimate 1-carboxyvinyltransferase